MNFINTNKKYFIMCFCVLFVFACYSPLNLNYDVDLKKKSPLSSIPSKTILLQMEDYRPFDPGNLIGYKRNNFFKWGPLKSQRPVTDVIYDALRDAFKQNGHKISISESDDYEILIKVRLKKFWINNCFIPSFNPFAPKTALNSTIIADIDLIKAKSNDVLLSEKINTSYQVPFNINIKSAYENTVNNALKNFVRDFSSNSKIIEALNNT